MGKRVSAYGLSFLLFCAIFLAAGCGGAGTTGVNGSNPPEIRFVQATPSEGAVNVLIDSTTSATINYGAASGYVTVTSGSRHIQMEPNGSATTFIDQNLSLGTGSLTTMVATGDAANITGVTFNDENAVVTSGDASIRVINASPSMGAADVYIVPAGTSIANASPTIANLAFKAATSYTDIAPGSYEVFLTSPGTKSTFTSTGTITLTVNQIRTLIAIDSLGGGFTQLTLSDAN
jgi:hypothetical protein